MAQLSTKIKMYCTANGVASVDFQKDVMLQDDGQGAYIKEWNLGIAKPTDEQLASYDADADKQEQNNQVVATRVSLYGTPAEQLEILVEQGLDKLIERNDKIKADNPKA
jgi:Fic family protein